MTSNFTLKRSFIGAYKVKAHFFVANTFILPLPNELYNMFLKSEQKTGLATLSRATVRLEIVQIF